LKITLLQNLITEDTFIISDTHFKDRDVTKYEPNRKSIAEAKGFKNSDELTINEIQKITKNGGNILHLGDLTKKTNLYSFYSKELGGSRNVLLKGNHDRGSKVDYCPKDGFNQTIEDGIIFIENTLYRSFNNKKVRYAHFYITDINGIRIMFSHFPVDDDNPHDTKTYGEAQKVLNDAFKAFKCNLNIHGHIHSKTAKEKYCINCSIDKTNGKPIKIKEIIEKAKEEGLIKEYPPQSFF